MNRNMKKTACILLYLAGMAFPAMAQNSIDRMVKQHSTTGKSTFTSAVERDPATRKVVKVVNILKSISCLPTPAVITGAILKILLIWRNC